MKLTVVLDGNAATPYAPLARTMHELGHIADFVSGPNQGFRRETGYQGGGWNQTSAENRPTALSEGLATLIGVTAFYDDYATEPQYCFADGNASIAANTHCYPVGVMNEINKYNVEESHDGSCSTSSGNEEGRWAISHTRFFWDVYDEIDDGGDSIDLSLYNIFDAQAAWPCPSYPACYSNNTYVHDQYSSVSSDLNPLDLVPGRVLREPSDGARRVQGDERAAPENVVGGSFGDERGHDGSCTGHHLQGCDGGAQYGGPMFPSLAFFSRSGEIRI